MTDSQSDIPESLEQEHRIPEGISFADRYAIHPLVYAFLTLMIVFLLYQVGGGVLSFIIIGATSITRENVGAMRWLTIAAQLGFILVPTLLLTKLFATRLRDVFRFRVPGLRESTVALIALVSLQRVFESYMYFQERVPLPDLIRDIIEPLKKLLEEVTKILVRADSPVELLAVILVVAVMPSIVEELLFRGLIQKIFERLMSPVVAAILAGTIFGLYHFNPFEIVPLVGLGVFFGLLRYRSQSLLVPIVAHFLNNLMAVLASYYGLDSDNALPAAKTMADAPVMTFEMLLFAALFFISFVAYLRITHNISRQVS
jgi:membrane protease YdiL (CAAX protease family)